MMIVMQQFNDKNILIFYYTAARSQSIKSTNFFFFKEKKKNNNCKSLLLQRISFWRTQLDRLVFRQTLRFPTLGFDLELTSMRSGQEAGTGREGSQLRSSGMQPVIASTTATWKSITNTSLAFTFKRNSESHGSVGSLYNCVALIFSRPTEVNSTGTDQSIGSDLLQVQEIALVPVVTEKTCYLLSKTRFTGNCCTLGKYFKYT